MRSIRSRALAACVTSLSAACFILSLPEASAQSAANADSSSGPGLFIARVTSNTPTLDRANFLYMNQWEKLVLTDASGSEIDIAPEPFSGNNGSYIFQKQLAPGKYRLKQAISAKAIGRVAAQLGGVSTEFEIKPGTVTSFGALIYQPTGNRGYTILCDSFDAPNFERVRAQYPALAQAMASKPPIRPCNNNDAATGTRRETTGGVIVVSNSAATSLVGTLTVGLIQSLVSNASATESVEAWKTETDPQKRLAMARSSTYVFNGPRMLASGEVLAGSNLGQVLLRKKDGSWQRLDTGDTREIVTLHADDAQHITVAGDEGLLMHTDDGGKSWTRPVSPTRGLITSLVQYQNRTLVLALEGADAVLYSSDMPGKGDWKEIRRETGIREEFKLPLANPHRTASETASGNVVGNHYVMTTANGAVNILNLSDNTWQSANTSFSNPRTVHALRDGRLYTFYKNKVMLSSDLGRTWGKDETACSRITLAAFGAGGKAYNVCGQGAFVFSTSIWSRQPGADQPWSKWVEETPAAVASLYASEIDDTVLYMTPDGWIYGHAPGANEWKLERKPL